MTAANDQPGRPPVVVCFGELLLRLSPPDVRLIAQADRFDLAVGGAEANVAAGLAALDHAVRFVGAVADNPLGDRARAALRATGVNTDFLVRAAGRMGLYFLEPGAGARPGRVIYDRADSAFARIAPESLDWGGALSGASLLHLSGITPALGPAGVALARAAMAAAHAAGVAVCLDGNYRTQLWSAWASEPTTVLRELVGQADMLIGNHRDIGLLLGRDFAGDWPIRHAEAAAAAFAAFPRLQFIAATERRIVSSDHHELTARVDRRDGTGQSESVAVTGIVERIGSGDAFVAGVLHAWLGGGDPQAMADTGLALAVLKHSVPGDMGFIGRDQLAAFSAQAGDVQR